ncbi:MAG: hypothetical protein U5N86_07620 [Planctomycetota bacterium]|nr:hypothetical protein [Planctomycetota bacterium]
MRVLVTGSTGFIGTHVLKHLDDLVILSSNMLRAKCKYPLAKVHKWTASEPVPEGALDGVDAVVRLAGEPVSGKWARREESHPRQPGARNETHC